MSYLKVIERGTVVVTDGVISHVLQKNELPNLNEDLYNVINAAGKALLPGFVDSHTHFVFGVIVKRNFHVVCKYYSCYS